MNPAQIAILVIGLVATFLEEGADDLLSLGFDETVLRLVVKALTLTVTGIGAYLARTPRPSAS